MTDGKRYRGVFDTLGFIAPLCLLHDVEHEGLPIVAVIEGVEFEPGVLYEFGIRVRDGRLGIDDGKLVEMCQLADAIEVATVLPLERSRTMGRLRRPKPTLRLA